ncbi:MAG TPA: RelA/SpoT domain-containing protein [Candidatus Acidoferrales bacterium]|jgi:ppGpp synthetase/RelA/SpoT-type nucleotidyltranferase|nr:RelA/SpoT domain-containing protein [Candidatus Acidoferrales bacterium]
MGWTQRQYSKGDIDRAGRALVTLAKDDPARELAITVVDNWRACHSYPLQIIKMTLFRRAKKIYNQALIAQRLKRRPSIEIKLRDNPQMKLSQMQDIGGCRAVLQNVSEVKKLVSTYKTYHAKSPKNRSSWDGSDDFDYISRPKEDGYRSVHLIFRFQSPSAERAVFNGQRIEIQIRSKLQHVWATAVETAQIFTGQALKSKVKNASQDWLRFFALTSSAFAHREKAPVVPGTPKDKTILVNELRAIVGRANIMDSLRGWNDAIHYLEDADMANAHQFLLVLDPNKNNLRVTQFSKESVTAAQRAYERAEKDTENDPTIQVVLVSVESVDALRKAYPNYYVDTRDFIKAVQKEIQA